MTKLGVPFEGMSWQETARARTSVVSTLARVLDGDARDRTSCETALELASLLAVFGHPDVAQRFYGAVIMHADDADVANRASQECLRLFPAEEGRLQGEDESGLDRSVEVAVMSIAELRAAVDAGEVSPGETVVLASTSVPKERGFEGEDFHSAVLLRYDDVADPAAKGALSSVQADEIAELVVDAVREGANPAPTLIACCCDGGVSRSAGVARAVALFLKGDGDAYRRSRETTPNEHVAATVFRALERAVEAVQSPLRRKIARRLQEFETARRMGGKDVGDQDFRLALERDLLAEDDKARCMSRVKSTSAVDALMPDGALLSGALYRVHGPAAPQFVRWLESQVASRGGRVAALGAGTDARPVGKGYLARLGAKSLCSNGPDGAALARTQLFLLEELGPIDAVFVESYSAAKEAWFSRYEKAVREGEQSDAFEDSFLRCLPGAVIVLDDREEPGEDSSIDERIDAAMRAMAMHAYEDLLITEGETDEELIVRRTHPGAHTHSTIDAGKREVTIAIGD